MLAAARRAGERAATRRAARRREEIAGAAVSIPGVRATIEGDAVVLEGRGLLNRWVRDARLRAIGRAGA